VLAADLQLAGDQLVVAEEVLGDPEIEGAGDRLRVLEPVLELAVPLQVGGSSRLASSCREMGHNALDNYLGTKSVVTQPRWSGNPCAPSTACCLSPTR
jgi:hypothetical protein